MKKIILALATLSVMALANESAVSNVTINATMKLMEQGLSDVQSGFIYHDKEKLTRGIQTLQGANSIFSSVDVSVFIPNNAKIQVTKNINANLAKDLESLQKSVADKKYAEATDDYSKVLNSCISCHTIIRGW
ncbi:MAG: cytochrome C [Sulfurimonas sp.]|nr:cytochrome C [Sulfurimonas sp.]MBU1218029.1 cytochrome C [bacterium]MBU1435170.1 cytochrome C [bacterium]MBU1502827.1 cytochrome C [bacterium]MBU3937997.1 cytochrome C [bacterium]